MAKKTTIPIGSLLGGYTFKEILGQGGFGTVYRVSLEENADLALKVLHHDLLGHPNAVDRFKREIAVIRSLRHDNVLSIHDVGTLPNGSPYFAMELLNGRDLHGHIRIYGRMTPERCLQIMKEICSVLQLAHDRGIVHRDIKASNVFMSVEGRVVLMDFGVAKITDTPGMTLTLSRQVVGSPCAMSPEQLTGGTIDGRTDVYALGALAYHMLTGGLPFTARSATVINNLHRHAARPQPSVKAPVSSAVDRVVTDAMSIEPGDRQRSPSAFLKALATAVDPASVEAGAATTCAVIAIANLGKLGTDSRRVREYSAALTDFINTMRGIGLRTVSRNSRGAVLAVPVNGDLDPLVERTYREIEKLQTALMPRLPAGSELFVKFGDVQIRDSRIESGAPLIPAHS